MDYSQCQTTGDVCLQVWLVDDIAITLILGLVVVVFGIKMLLKITPFIG